MLTMRVHQAERRPKKTWKKVCALVLVPRISSLPIITGIGSAEPFCFLFLIFCCEDVDLVAMPKANCRGRGSALGEKEDGSRRSSGNDLFGIRVARRSGLP